MSSVPCPGPPECVNPNYHLHTAPSDPAYALLANPNIHSTPNPAIYRSNCYICTDPEFAQMGMPLCTACLGCKTGHVAADDEICDDCGASQYELYMAQQESGEPIKAEVVEPHGIGPGGECDDCATE